MKKINKLSVRIILIFGAILLVVVSTFWMISRNLRLRDENLGFMLHLITVILLVVMGMIFVWIINKMVITRVRQLNEAANEVAKGNYEIKLAVKGNDELSQFTNTFNQMIAELKNNEYIGKEFVSNVSHEFKTPISAIKAYAELIENEIKQPTLKEYAEIIMQESDRLVLLTKSMLQLAMLDNTVIVKKEDTFSPAEQVCTILRLMQKSWEAKNIELDLRLDDFSIVSNEQLLYQVWQNLISNAIKFSNLNGVVSIKIQKTANKTYFEIHNHGVVIEESNQERIFNQFFMADQSRSTEGSGLGLSIVKKIVDRLDGMVGFESQEKSGTRFFVSI
jgi:signal transduction histidine kinase